MDDDDIWASSDEDNTAYDRSIAEREWNKMNINHGNEGYKEGITEAKEEYMQEGFDRGYTEGLEVGKAIGKLRGIVSTQMTFYRDILHDQEKTKRLQELYDELCRVDVQDIFSKEYFQDDKNANPHHIVKQWQDKVSSFLDNL
ncbi:hypothetical protein BDA99DRAFT_564424 [Phascolomyces articulosus]|uniref:Protein YAE1 n=1 Tax=Phascolomyces articulosus TaxID=60185 RepID=A0AAD5JQ91_9FUNG|nr:hypothetical protein BDA99DRAFT_564424 [Phascolomyces articulosus]